MKNTREARWTRLGSITIDVDWNTNGDEKVIASINVKQTMQNQTGFYTNYLAIFTADNVETKSSVSFVDHNCSRLSEMKIVGLAGIMDC